MVRIAIYKQIFFAAAIATLLVPGTLSAEEHAKPSVERRIEWGDDLGGKSRVLSLVGMELCYRAPCPGDIFADDEGKRFGVVRVDFGDKKFIEKYNNVSSRLRHCGARLRGTFRRGSLLDDKPLIDLVVEEVIEGPDPTCK